MALHTFALIQFITVTVAFLAVAIFRPQWLRTIGGILCRLSDAMIAARETFHQSEAPKRTTPARKPTPPTSEVIEIPTPTQQDVIKALVAQGAPKRKAEQSVKAAAAMLPADVDFTELWRKAVTLAA